MALTRLYVDDKLSPGAELRLDKDQARYLGRVLRLQAGDSVHVFNGDDGEFDASITSLAKAAATVQVGQPVASRAESPLRIHLVQGISRGDRMDFVVQKATELGVKRISPVFTDHGVVRLDDKRARKRHEHWRGVAASACEQSGRVRPPLIDVPVSLNSWFGASTKEAACDLILRPGAGTALASLESPVTKICLLIGPEGGFSDPEYDDAEVAGFRAVSLGPRVLRTETAALAAVAVAQSAWGDLG